MNRTNYMAIGAAAATALVVGTLAARDAAFSASHAAPAVWQLAEFGKDAVVAFVLAHFAVRLQVLDRNGGIQLGLWIWTGFQATLLIGAVLHEGITWKLYSIHAGDALAKTLSMSVILGSWPR